MHAASRTYIPCRRVYADFIFIPLNGNKEIRIQSRKVVVKLKGKKGEIKREKKFKIQ